MEFVIQCVDEKDLRRRFVPRLLGNRRKRYRLARYLGFDGGPSALDARRADAGELWQRAQKALLSASAQRALDLVLDLAVLYSSAGLPHEDESGPSLTFWNETLPGLPSFDQSPFSRFPEQGLAELFEIRPDLRDVTPSIDPDVRVFGLYIPPGSVPSVLAWLQRAIGALGRAERLRFERIEVALTGCAQNNWGYWETAGVRYERALRFQRLRRQERREWDLLAAWKGGVLFQAQAAGLLLACGYDRRLTLFDLEAKTPRVVGEVDGSVVRARRNAAGEWVGALASWLPGAQIRVFDGRLNLLRQVAVPADFPVASHLLDIVWYENRFVLVPENAGCRLWVESEGSLKELSELPSSPVFDSGHCWNDRSLTHGSFREPDGTGVLVAWGDGYVECEGTFQLRWHLSAESHVSGQWQPLADGLGGIYFLSHGRLYHVPEPKQLPKRVLPDLANINAIGSGPGDWLVLSHSMDRDGGIGKIHNARTSVTRPLSVYTVGGEPTRDFHMDAIVWSEVQQALVFRRGLRVKSVPWDTIEKHADRSIEPLPETSDAIEIVGGDSAWSQSDSYADGLRRRIAAAIFWDPDRPWHTAPRLPKGHRLNVRVSERGELLSITGDPEIVERVGKLPRVRPITWRQGEWAVEIEFNRTAAMSWIRDVWSRIGP